MSLNKFSETANGISTKLKIGCEEFKATTSADIIGNVFPSSSTTAGYVLSNTDGVGTLNWVDPTTTSGVSSGTYTPAITFDGGSLVNQKVSPWTRVGDVVNFSGSFLMTLPSGTSSVEIKIPLPAGTGNTANDNCSATAIGGLGTGNSVIAYDYTMSANSLSIFCKYAGGTIFGGLNSTILWSCQFLSDV